LKKMKTILSMLFLLLAGCSGLRDGGGVAAAPRVIEAGDTVIVLLRDADPVVRAEEVVDREGQILLPLIQERTSVVGLTSEQAGDRLKELYAREGYHLQIVVAVRAAGEAAVPSPLSSTQEATREPRQFSPEYCWGRKRPQTVEYWSPQEIQGWEWRTGERFPGPRDSTGLARIIPYRPDASRVGGDVEPPPESARP
jgi:hypothetical protein